MAKSNYQITLKKEYQFHNRKVSKYFEDIERIEKEFNEKKKHIQSFIDSERQRHHEMVDKIRREAHNPDQEKVFYDEVFAHLEKRLKDKYPKCKVHLTDFDIDGATFVIDFNEI